MNINALIFDMDDTLYSERDYVMSGYKVLDNWIETYYKKSGFYETAAYLFESGERRFVFNKTMEQLNINYNEDIIRELVRKYRSHEPKINLYNDAKWIINHLNNTIKIGLISDGFLITQQKKVNALKLKGIFHSIILSDSYGRENWKPSKIPYERSSDELQCSHQECVYIGDNLAKDFITAKKLGWTTVHIERESGLYTGAMFGPDYQAHYRINNLRELIDIPEFKEVFHK